MAVLVSLAYLSLQARHNAISFRRAESTESLKGASAFRLAIAENRDVAHLWTVGLMDDGTLDETDELRFEMILGELFWHHFNLWDRARLGVYGKTGYQNWLSDLAKPLATKRGTRWWDINKTSCEPEYALAVSKAIDNLRTAAGRN